MVLPNFLIVGTPKAGTTAIYHYLNQHPEIYLSPHKEPHLFSFIGERQPHWGIQTLNEYEQLFDGVTIEKAIGEASTWYLYSQTAAEQIKQYIPDAKIIIMLRNPIERAYSSWAFRVQCGWESITDFQQALAVEKKRIAQKYEWDFHYLQVGFYARQIKRYLELFTKEQIHICLYDDFKNNPVKEISAIFDFLKVNPDFIPDTDCKHNITTVPKNHLIHSLFKTNSQIKDKIKIMLPTNLRNTLVNRFKQNNYLQLPPLSSKIRREYNFYYQEDILKTALLINRDISHWLDV